MKRLFNFHELVIGVLVALLPIQVFAELRSADVLFSSNIAGILNSHCIACHASEEQLGSISLVGDKACRKLSEYINDRSALKLVDPGFPQDSYLLRKIRGDHREVGGYGARMPLGGPYIEESKVELIERWIIDGAHCK